MVTHSKAQPRLDRALAPRGGGSGGDPGPFRPTSATHKIFFQRRAPVSRSTPHRIPTRSGNHRFTTAIRFGVPPFAARHFFRAYAGRRASDVCSSSCCERSGRAPRSHFARVVSLSSKRRVKRTLREDRLRTPFTHVLLSRRPTSSIGASRALSSSMKPKNRTNEAHELLQCQPTHTHLTRASGPRPCSALRLVFPRGKPPLSRSTSERRAA